MEQIGQLSRLDGLDSLIHLIENKGEIKKVIAEINAARDEANAQIAKLGKIGDIDKFNTQATKALEQANSALVDANAEADGIVSEARHTASSEAKKTRKAKDKLAEKESLLLSLERSVAARENELQNAMDSVSKLNKTATKLKTEADELMDKANAQLAIFEAAVGRLQ